MHAILFSVSLHIGVICFGIGVVQYLLTSKNKNLLKMIKVIPTSKIGDLRPGKYAEIQGKVTNAYTIPIPDDDGNCVWYSRIILDPRQSNSEEIKYIIIDKNELSTTFEIKDDTGAIRVDCRGADFNVAPIVQRDLQESDQHYQNNTKKLFRQLTSKYAGRERRLEIRCIKPEMHCYVLGKVRLSSNRQLIMRKDDKPFLISTYQETELIDVIEQRLAQKVLMAKIGLISGVVMVAVGLLGLVFL